ncbi:MAG: extracellular solute-binding protein [Myxococcota bacterium]
MNIGIRHHVIVLSEALAALVAVALIALGSACSTKTDPVQIRFWHAFNDAETEALNRALEAWKPDSPAAVVPLRETFARARVMLTKSLSDDQNCPDLARIDASWLPGLAEDGLLAAGPKRLLSSERWLPRAAALNSYQQTAYAAPQTVDGLALIYRKSAMADAGAPWPPTSMDELVSAGGRLAGDGTYGFSVLVDGYWFVPFLREWGDGLLDPISGQLNIDTPRSARALNRFSSLFGTVMPPAGDSVDRLFRDGDLPVAINGPWAVAGLTSGNTEGFAVAALPGAPLGGQLLVVPRCAKEPGWAWKLAEYLTSPDVQGEWAQTLGVIPTTRAGLDRAGDFVQQFYRALTAAEPLPRSPITPNLFDDFTPAVKAVVAGDATAEETRSAAARQWGDLLKSRGIKPRFYRAKASTATPPGSPQ